MDAHTRYEQEKLDGQRCPYCGSDEREDRRIVAHVGPALEPEEVDTCENEWHAQVDEPQTLGDA